jgi:aminoglycoside phosphotransferase (APT) family kinase protein
MTDGRRITGVLDWSNALPGDRRADLARTESILWLMQRVPRPPRWWEWLTLRRFRRGWLVGYAQVAGRQPGMSAASAWSAAWYREMPVFYAWAGALMHRDLAPRVGRPDTALTEAHLAAIRAWTARWKRKAGVEE